MNLTSANLSFFFHFVSRKSCEIQKSQRFFVLRFYIIIIFINVHKISRPPPASPFEPLLVLAVACAAGAAVLINLGLSKQLQSEQGAEQVHAAQAEPLQAAEAAPQNPPEHEPLPEPIIGEYFHRTFKQLVRFELLNDQIKINYKIFV